jgi:hypothetical protein
MTCNATSPCTHCVDTCRSLIIRPSDRGMDRTSLRDHLCARVPLQGRAVAFEVSRKAERHRRPCAVGHRAPSYGASRCRAQSRGHQLGQARRRSLHGIAASRRLADRLALWRPRAGPARGVDSFRGFGRKSPDGGETQTRQRARLSYSEALVSEESGSASPPSLPVRSALWQHAHRIPSRGSLLCALWQLSRAP